MQKQKTNARATQRVRKRADDAKCGVEVAKDTVGAGVTAARIDSPGQEPVETLGHPPPDYVANVARSEANPRLVADYVEAIGVLRDEKRFTFREIAAWLTEKFGIEADHNAVYRAYTKGMSEGEARAAATEDDDDERQERIV